MQRLQFPVFFNRFVRILTIFLSVLVVSDLQSEEPARILFFGDSLTAGYGIDSDVAYPALIQQKIDAAEGLNVKVIVGAVSGDTSAGGLRRIDWMLRQPVDVFVLALGANDGLRGIDTADTAKNLQGIIDKVSAKFPNVHIVIAGMRLPPSLGREYVDEFAAIFPSLAKENGATLIPLLLEGVGGIVRLNLPDRIHPNREGHAILAETVWEVLEPVVVSRLQR